MENLKVENYTPARSENDGFGHVPEQRFAIINEVGAIVDDAQGWGYKTKQKAFAAMSYKFGGGRNKAKVRKANYYKWVNADPKNKKAIELFEECVSINFKELAREEVTIKEVWEEVEKELNIEIPAFIRQYCK